MKKIILIISLIIYSVTIIAQNNNKNIESENNRLAELAKKSIDSLVKANIKEIKNMPPTDFMTLVGIEVQIQLYHKQI